MCCLFTVEMLLIFCVVNLGSFQVQCVHRRKKNSCPVKSIPPITKSTGQCACHWGDFGWWVLSRFVAAFVTARLLLFTRLVRIGPSSRAQLANRTQFTIRAALLVVWPVQLVWALFARVNATLGRIAGAGRARANLALFPSVWRPEIVILK